jgi:hypothetical protein
MTVKDGVFFLQRADNTFLAKFSFNSDSIRHFNKPEFDFAGGVNIHESGQNLSAIMLTNMKLA